MDHIRRSFPWVLCMSACIAALIVLAPAVSAGSVTRGSTFTLTIDGKPLTAYYVWFKGTFSMTGKPGDQPPVIVANTENVVFDPDEGPYVIGSYRFYNGNGKTIHEDVAPSSDTVSNTRYYAQVTTDYDGFGIVQFQTSSATADRTFTIKAENPASPGEDVPVSLGLPARRTTAITATPTLPATPVSLPATPAEQPSPELKGSQGETQPTTPKTSVPVTSPSPQAPTGVPLIVLAVVAGILVQRRAQ